jgi:tetratricopeptide (TPR) repeat protein
MFTPCKSSSRPSAIANSVLSLALTFVAFSGMHCTNRAVQVAQQSWVEVRTDQLRLIGDVDPSLLIRLGRDLELFRHFLLFDGIARWPDHVAPFTVVVVGSRFSYGVFSADPSIAGRFTVTLRGSYATVNLDAGFNKDDSDQNILFHEYVHFLLAYNSGFFYPSWYEEGFAEYLSTFRVDDEGGVDVGIPSEPRIRQLTRRWIPLQRLFTERPVSYPQAWITVHYLNSSPHRYSQLMEYLTQYNGGLTSDEAFAQAFDLSYKDLQREIRTYYRSGNYPYTHFEPGELAVVDPPDVQILKDEEVLLELGALFLNASEELGTARKLFEKALENDPASARARAGLAAVALASDDLDTAAAHLETALEVDPNSEWAHTLYGNLLIRRADEHNAATKSQLAAELEQARSEYARAIQLDAKVPEPYWRLATTFRGDSSAIEASIKWLESARRLQPLEPRLSLDLASLRVERGQFAEARRLVEGLTDGHGRAARDEARVLLRRLERLELEAKRVEP